VLIVTTTATITRPDGDGDPYEAATVTTVATGVDAHLSAPTGDDVAVGGDKEIIEAVVYLPSGTDVTRYDLITVGAQTYSTVWVHGRSGLGLGYVAVGVRAVNGGAAA